MIPFSPHPLSYRRMARERERERERRGESYSKEWSSAERRQKREEEKAEEDEAAAAEEERGGERGRRERGPAGWRESYKREAVSQARINSTHSSASLPRPSPPCCLNRRRHPVASPIILPSKMQKREREKDKTEREGKKTREKRRCARRRWRKKEETRRVEERRR